MRRTQYVTVEEGAARLAISSRRLRLLCAQSRVRGARRIGRDWIVPLAKDGMPEVRYIKHGPRPKWDRFHKGS